MNDSTTDAVLEPMVATLSYHVELDRADADAIRRLPFKIGNLHRHDFVVRDGEPTAYSCVLLKGFVVRSKVAGNGNRQILAIHMRGDMIDLQNSMLGKADHSVQALTEVEIAMIPREDIVRLAVERPTVGRAMWINTLVEASIAREWILNVGQRDARTRLAHMLCEFGLRLRIAHLSDGHEYELPMTQEELADTTGLTPIHVNRTLKSLDAQGLIERTSPRAVRIRDWREMASAGDFDSNYLHLKEYEPALG